VDISYQGKIHRIGAGLEVVLSLGAIHTPKVLMQSGAGDKVELRRLGIPVLQHLWFLSKCPYSVRTENLI
jgi:choline dehydrogenase